MRILTRNAGVELAPPLATPNLDKVPDSQQQIVDAAGDPIRVPPKRFPFL